ncbi:MAG: ABC transporter ATP-binding protein [Sulfuricurvum sp. PC08-66]|nr:MAG: ABC transporter ATP-binding protein [Sulfuricurvum sp. PC08-66]
MLEASHLSHAFDYPLFNDISFSLSPKESMAIVGVSGSGKSTLLHILASMLVPQSGKVFWKGVDMYAQKSAALLAMRRLEIGIIFQQHYLFKGFKAYENLEVAALLAHQSIDEALLERLGIANVMGQKVTELSGGQQQRVSIARVLTKRPQIIFADEPTGNLDEETANEVMQILHDYLQSNNAMLVMVTHDKHLAQKCNRYYALHQQQLILL